MINNYCSLERVGCLCILLLLFGCASNSVSKELDEKITFAYHQTEDDGFDGGPVRTTFLFCIKNDILLPDELMSIVFTTSKKFESSRVETGGVKSDDWVVQRFSVMNDFFQSGRNVSLYFKDSRYKKGDYSRHVIDVKKLLAMPNLSKYKLLELPKFMDCGQAKRLEKKLIQKLSYGFM